MQINTINRLYSASMPLMLVGHFFLFRLHWYVIPYQGRTGPFPSQLNTDILNLSSVYYLLISIRFPKNIQLKSQWVKAVGRDDWQPSKTSRLCSKHFVAEHFFKSRSGRLKLHPNSLPTVFLPEVVSLPYVQFIIQDSQLY